jgi:hypothetical protein
MTAMGFGHTLRADDLSLSEQITIKHPETGNWVTGTVVALILLRNGNHRIRLQFGSGQTLDYDCDPSAPVIHDPDTPVDHRI